MAREIEIEIETEIEKTGTETGIGSAEEDHRICTVSVGEMIDKIFDLNQRGSCLVGVVLGGSRIALEESMMEIEIGGIDNIEDGIHEIEEEVEEGTTGEGEVVGMVG